MGERDKRSAPGRRAGELPASPFSRRAPMDDRIGAQDGHVGWVLHVVTHGTAFHAVCCRFLTTSGFANPLPA